MEDTNQDKKKTGRKPLPREQALIQVQIRITRELHASILSEARRQNMRLSEWCRWALGEAVKGGLGEPGPDASTKVPITLTRSLDRPLRFTGVTLASVTPDMSDVAGRRYSGQLARTDGGAYVASVQYRTDWDKETDHEYVHVGTPGDIAAWLTGFNYMAPVVGYPEGVNGYARKTRILNDQLKKAWLELVTTLLEYLPPETIS